MYVLPPASDEQRCVVDAVIENNNVIVDAVAGSGKTTTILHIAKANPDKSLIVVTYNKDLKQETREKVLACGITNIEIHSYHSLFKKYYSHDDWSDSRMQDVIQQNEPIYGGTYKCNILVIDEAQDMIPYYYALMVKFIKDIKKSPQLVFLGDVMQEIWQKKGADKRFLSHADKMWNNRRAFIKLKLSISYRVTKPIASFVNRVMLRDDRIKAVKDGPSVDYMLVDPWNSAAYLAAIIQNKIAAGASPADFFILAPSMKTNSNSPTSKLEHKLVEAGIPVYFPNNDEGQTDSDVTRGKVVFSTHHQSKGRERPYVIIFTFDEQYFNFFAKDEPRRVCPPTLYVAATRASKHLIVLHAAAKKGNPAGFLPFIDSDALLHANVIDTGYKFHMVRPSATSPKLGEQMHRTSVTDLVRHLDNSVVYLLQGIVREIYKRTSDAHYSIELPSLIETEDGRKEDVSVLNALAVMTSWEHSVRGKSSVYEQVAEFCHKNSASFYAEFFNEDELEGDVGKLLQLANVFNCMNHNLHHPLRQIKEYNWTTLETISECANILRKEVPLPEVFEEDVSQQGIKTEFGIVDITARIDAFDKENVYEIKCVERLELEHFLQLIVYAYLCRIENGGLSLSKRFSLINCRTGERWELIGANSRLIDEAMYLLFADKYSKKSRPTDEEFLADNFAFVRGCLSRT